MKPWVKYLALVIGLLALLAMATIVVGCAAQGTQDNPIYATCTN